MIVERSFDPGTVAAEGTITIPADFPPMKQLVAVALTVSTGAAAMTTTQETPQDTAPTASGESYLASATTLEIGDATTAGQDRLFLRYKPLGGEPATA